jgi:formate hydrogenlyase transcriptional activator
MDTWVKLLASGEPGELEARLRRHDGEYRWFLFRVEPLHDELGSIVRWYGTNTDIEDLKRAQSLLSTEKGTLEMVALGASLSDVLEHLCDAIDAQAHGTISTVLLMDSDGKRLWPTAGRRVPNGWAKAISPLAIGPSMGSCGTAAFRKEPVICSDIASDPLWSAMPAAEYRDIALRHGLRAAWSQPLISKDGEVLGTFAMYYAEPRSPTYSDFQLIERAGHVALIAIERDRSQAALVTALHEIKKSEAHLRQDEEELRRITDAIPQMIVVLHPDGRTLYANRMALDYTGLTLQDIRAENFRDRAFHPEDIQRVQEQRRAALANNVPFENEQRCLRKDGKYRWFLNRYNPLLDEDGKVIRWYATGTDIEDRKHAEDRIRNENIALREEIERSSMFEEIVGSSEALRLVLRQVSKVAPMDSTVLILGETGTGKELIARAIHNRSKRSSRAFIRVNCAAIPASLIASELFGHEKGSFTGALQRRLGRFESADGGTIFLDEVGELPAETQVALLRVLQEREFERIGGNQTISIDVRVLAATNRDLSAAVAEGTFRRDLFYRLNVFPIRLPALRERVDDIQLLVEYLIDRYAQKAGKKIRNITKDTLALFQSYEWPGNIRELQNVIERAVILCDGETLSVDEAWLTPADTKSAVASVQLIPGLAERERQMIESALQDCKGLISGPTGAAARLGIPRQTLVSKITKLGINRHLFKPA